MPFGWEARGRDFPRRNRVVSGLSLGVVIVEAARRSGSLITARFAGEQGREVFAVPGSPLDPRAEGTNDLLRDGATLCTQVDDIIRALADRVPGRGGDDLFADPGKSAEPPLWDELDLPDADGNTALPLGPHPAADLFAFREPAPSIAPAQDDRAPLDRVTERLGPAPVSIDELARAVELPIGDVRSALLRLEMAGRLERHGGGLVSLIMS
jgi:DNA processing protein